MFVLGENHFQKCFSVNAGVWLVQKIEFSGNQFHLTVKNTLWPRKFISIPIFTSNGFQTDREREREREEEEGKPRAPIQSNDHWQTPSSNPTIAHASRTSLVDCSTAPIAPHRSILPSCDLAFYPLISLSVWVWFLCDFDFCCCCGGVVVVAFDFQSLLPWVELPCEKFEGK